MTGQQSGRVLFKIRQKVCFNCNICGSGHPRCPGKANLICLGGKTQIHLLIIENVIHNRHFRIVQPPFIGDSCRQEALRGWIPRLFIAVNKLAAFAVQCSRYSGLCFAENTRYAQANYGKNRRYLLKLHPFNSSLTAIFLHAKRFSVNILFFSTAPSS